MIRPSLAYQTLPSMAFIPFAAAARAAAAAAESAQSFPLSHSAQHPRSPRLPPVLSPIPRSPRNNPPPPPPLSSCCCRCCCLTGKGTAPPPRQGGLCLSSIQLLHPEHSPPLVLVHVQPNCKNCSTVLIPYFAPCSPSCCLAGKGTWPAAKVACACAAYSCCSSTSNPSTSSTECPRLAV